MAKAICQHALDRVMLYLRCHGIVPTPAVSHRALALVDECLAAAPEDSNLTGSDGSAPADIMARVMDRLPETFDLPASSVPAQQPPVRRGSIGYGP